MVNYVNSCKYIKVPLLQNHFASTLHMVQAILLSIFPCPESIFFSRPLFKQPAGRHHKKTRRSEAEQREGLVSRVVGVDLPIDLSFSEAGGWGC